MRTLLPSPAASCQNPTTPVAAVYDRRIFEDHLRTAFYAPHSAGKAQFLAGFFQQDDAHEGRTKWLGPQRRHPPSLKLRRTRMHADGEKKNSGFFICANLRHLRAILDSVAVFRAVFVALFVAMSCLSVSAQIQQAWVARCNNGITNGTHQAVKMALDPVGNVYVTGFSQNTNGNLDYLTLKYAPNGNQVWTARFDSTNTATAKPAAIRT